MVYYSQKKVNKSLDTIDSRLDKVESSIESLRETVENNATEFRSHFKHIETKLDRHEKQFEVFAEAIRGNEIDIKFLSEKSGVHEKEINQIKTRIQI